MHLGIFSVSHGEYQYLHHLEEPRLGADLRENRRYCLFDVKKRCSKRWHNARTIAGGNRGESRVAWALKGRRCPLFLALAPRRHLHFDPLQVTATVT
jgi:hypothetical protein